MLILSASASADVYINSGRIELLRRGQVFLFQDSFAVADSLARKVIAADPLDPLGYLMRAGALMGEMAAMEEDLAGDDLRMMTKIVDSLAQLVADTADSNTAAWMELFRGEALVHRAIWESRFGSRMSAVSLAFDVRGHYRRGLDFDSTVYDLYLGMGQYHYWKSVKAGPLRWVGILNNDIDLGIKEIYLASDSALVYSELARNSLIWVWLQEKEYDSVVVVSNEMLAKYPLGSTILWPLGEALFRLGKLFDAADVYRSLRQHLLKRPGNYYNLIECDYQLYRCLKALEQFDEAKQIARSVEQYYKHVSRRVRASQRSELALLRRVARR